MIGLIRNNHPLNGSDLGLLFTDFDEQFNNETFDLKVANY